MNPDERPIRIVLAKLGLDGHDRGLRIVGRMLRDAGMEVIQLGLRQTTDTIVGAARDEDADAVGLSMHNAGHLTLAPRMRRALDDAGLDIPLVVGGIIPEQDVAHIARTRCRGDPGPRRIDRRGGRDHPRGREAPAVS